MQTKHAKLIIATYSITPQRNHDGIDFAGPYMVSPEALLVRANDTQITGNDKKEMVGRSVCTVEGTTTAGSNDIPGAIMNTQPATTKDCVDLLAANGTDAVYTNELILRGYVHSRPNDFKIVFSGGFGKLQYTGVGILGGHHNDCLQLDNLITKYLNSQWTQDFQASFPDAVSAYPENDVNSGGFVSKFKPTPDHMQELSCKL